MILYILILILIVGGILSWLAAFQSKVLSRWVSLIAITADFLIILFIWITNGNSDLSDSGRWIIEVNYSWIERFGISFHFALDGLSIILLSLTFFLGMLSVLVSWSQIKMRVGFFHLNISWILAGITGVFLSLDLFLFYFFWELMLVPMYFIIAIWGHEKRRYAGYKFFLFTQLSGLMMFIAILGLYFIHGAKTGVYSFDLTVLSDVPMAKNISWWLMGGFLIAFLVKLPVVPFHSWLPDAHTEAPTAGSVILAGLLLKTGAYGILRIVIPLFPETLVSFSPYGMMLGVIGILYGAKLAFAQKDLKKMIAYSSISHMGFIMMGLFALNELAYQGVVMQIVAHGISTASLFILAGILQERMHTRNIEKYGGLWKQIPRMGGVTLVFALASLGLPGMANFVAEFLTVIGVFKESILMAVLAATGFVLSTVYALKLFQSTFHGREKYTDKISDLNIRESLIFIPLLIFIFWFGLYPKTIFNLSEKPLQNLLERKYNTGETLETETLERTAFFVEEDYFEKYMAE